MERREFIKAGSAGLLHCSLLRTLGGETAVSAPGQPPQSLPRSEARYYRRLPDKKVECQLCPHQCRVANLERGTCGVRENREGEYQTLVYGNICSLNVDPIEKKPLFHYLPASRSLSVATAGCNFFCRFCQNWEISQKRPEQVRFTHLLPGDLVTMARQRECRTIAHTYTEPVVFTEYVLDCARTGKEKNIPSVMISNGFINEEPMRDLCRYLGAVKIDLKAFTEEFYEKYCSGSLQPVLDTLVLLKTLGVWLEIVVLIIPGLNDGPDEINRMTRWIHRELGPDVPLHFSRYYPTFMMKNIPPTSKKSLLEARKIAVDNGIRFVYVGNILTDYAHTYCPRCGELLIERYGYHTRITGLKSGACGKCGEEIPGRFQE